MTTDPVLGDLLRIHLDVLAELVDSHLTGSDVCARLREHHTEPPSRSRVYQILSELDEAGLVDTEDADHHHNAVQYRATDRGEVRVKEYAAHLGSRVFD